MPFARVSRENYYNCLSMATPTGDARPRPLHLSPVVRAISPRVARRCTPTGAPRPCYLRLLHDDQPALVISLLSSIPCERTSTVVGAITRRTGCPRVHKCICPGRC